MKEKMLNRVKKVLFDKNFYLFLFISLMFFGMFVRMNYATDTYSVLCSEKRTILTNFIRAGRFVTGFFFAAFSVLKIKIGIAYLCSFLLAIFSITISMYELFNFIKSEIKSELICFLISVLTIINPFSVEMLLYIEKGVMTLSILFCTLGAIKMVEFFKERKLKKLIVPFMYMIIAVFSYQGTVALFVIISTVFIIKYSKSFKDFVVNNIATVGIYGISALINLILVKILSKGGRLDGNVDLKLAISIVWGKTPDMFHTYEIISHNLFVIMILLSLLLTFIVIFKNKNKLIRILELAYILVFVYMFSIAPQLMQRTENVWLVARSTYAFASMLGVIQLFAVMIDEKECKRIYNGFAAIAIIFLMVEFSRFIKIETDNFNTNYTDRLIANDVYSEILKYEKETGNHVENIAIYKDKNPRYAYPNIFASGDINVTGFATDWSDVNLINYYNNINLKKVEKDKEIEENFANNDWTRFDSREQIIFKNNTIHLCVY